MDGSMPIMLSVVARPMSPISMPLSMVLTMEAEDACWATLSDAAEMM